jgi:L-amino acid N-acyltransferase YncA
MNRDTTIRVAKEDDAEALLAIYAPYVEKTAITFEYAAPTVEEFKQRIRNTLKKYPYLVAEKDGKIVGYAYAGSFKEREAYDWSVEISIYVDGKCHRQGIGALLMQSLETKLKEQGITNMNACIAYPEKEDGYLTQDSVRFHAKMGFSLVGQFHQCGRKFDRWYDMVWMEKMIAPHLDNQPKVKPFSA